MKKLLKEWLMPIWFLFKYRTRYTQRGLSLINTIYINLRSFPIHIAIKFPIFLYKNTKIYKLGKLNIECSEISTGMICWGKYDYKTSGKGKIYNAGEIIFKGPVIIGGSSIIENIGLIIFGGFNQLGEGGLFLIREKMEIGEFTRIGFLCFFMDSDDHYMISIENNRITKNTSPIIIGKYNWIAAKTTIKKGSITPPFTIVASGNTLVAKDYSDIGPYCVLGGVPAKVIGQGFRRIYNLRKEYELHQYFKSNPDASSINIDVTEDKLDEYCLSNALNF